MVELVEITEDNRATALGLQLGPGQARFVSTVRDSFAEALEYPQANPWYRLVVADGRPVGFVMLSWDAVPDPPVIWGPWFLWKLMIDHRFQGHGYGAQVVQAVCDVVRSQGGTGLLTSVVEGPGGPEGFYRRLGFVRTGDYDDSGETILRLDLAAPPAPG